MNSKLTGEGDTGPPTMTKLRPKAPEFSNAAIIGTPANAKYFKAKDIKIV